MIIRKKFPTYHSDLEPLKIGTLELDHSLLRSLAHSLAPLTHSLCTARFACALHYAHLFVSLFAHSLGSSWDS